MTKDDRTVSTDEAIQDLRGRAKNLREDLFTNQDLALRIVGYEIAAGLFAIADAIDRAAAEEAR